MAFASGSSTSPGRPNWPDCRSAVDVQDPKIESGETVAARVKAHKWLAPEQTIVTSSCGFNHLSRRVTFGKLQAMAEAKRLLGG
jgi:5-methyltetrahydropteroyltriglutamate--homocysteine methyltransferase